MDDACDFTCDPRVGCDCGEQVWLEDLSYPALDALDGLVHRCFDGWEKSACAPPKELGKAKGADAFQGALGL